ncbi:hypothetical protein LX36DRAFT_321205 [Colletotrichum falcatum]|nr:hypothetical protein LX36DRAFT_321205 [Colletotrichum falcatum]
MRREDVERIRKTWIWNGQARGSNSRVEDVVDAGRYYRSGRSREEVAVAKGKRLGQEGALRCAVARRRDCDSNYTGCTGISGISIARETGASKMLGCAGNGWQCAIGYCRSDDAMDEMGAMPGEMINPAVLYRVAGVQDGKVRPRECLAVREGGGPERRKSRARQWFLAEMAARGIYEKGRVR